MNSAPVKTIKLDYEAWKKWIERSAQEAEDAKPTRNNQMELALKKMGVEPK